MTEWSISHNTLICGLLCNSATSWVLPIFSLLFLIRLVQRMSLQMVCSELCSLPVSITLDISSWVSAQANCSELATNHISPSSLLFFHECTSSPGFSSILCYVSLNHPHPDALHRLSHPGIHVSQALISDKHFFQSNDYASFLELLCSI